MNDYSHSHDMVVEFNKLLRDKLPLVEESLLIVCNSKGRPKNDWLRFIADTDDTGGGYLSDNFRCYFVYLVESDDCQAYAEAAKNALASSGARKLKVVIVRLPNDKRGLVYSRYHAHYLAYALRPRAFILTDDDIVSFSFRENLAYFCQDVRRELWLCYLALLHEAFLNPWLPSIGASPWINAPEDLRSMPVAGLFALPVGTAQPHFDRHKLFTQHKPFGVSVRVQCQFLFVNVHRLLSTGLSPIDLAKRICHPLETPTFSEDVWQSKQLLDHFGLFAIYFNFAYFASRPVAANQKGGGLSSFYTSNSNLQRAYTVSRKYDGRMRLDKNKVLTNRPDILVITDGFFSTQKTDRKQFIKSCVERIHSIDLTKFSRFVRTKFCLPKSNQ